MICLFLKNPENFIRFILRDRYPFVRMPFDSMVKFQFLTQFLEDPLPHLVVSSIFEPVCYIDYMMNRFVFFPHDLLLLHCALSILALIDSYGVFFCSTFRIDSDSLFSCPFFSHSQVFLFEISSVYRLIYLYSCFFPISFS